MGSAARGFVYAKLCHHDKVLGVRLSTEELANDDDCFKVMSNTGSVRVSPNGTIGNFTNGTIGSQWYHLLTMGPIVPLGEPMVPVALPLVQMVLPMVPLVKP